MVLERFRHCFRMFGLIRECFGHVSGVVVVPSEWFGSGVEEVPGWFLSYRKVSGMVL